VKKLNSLLVLLLGSILVSAQQPAAKPAPRTVRCHPCTHRVAKAAAPRLPTPAPPPSAEFFVGEARVDVTKDETVVKLAMAQHGSVLIELPANDGPRYIIPGDPEMATVDQKALERNKRAIVVRPGEQFLPPLHNLKMRSPAATVTAQMRSGLVVTFLFYPVEDLAQNVHRCVLAYNRDEVVARRRAAGLPVNLDGGELTVQPAAPTSISVEPTDNAGSDKEPEGKLAIPTQNGKDSKPEIEVNGQPLTLATAAESPQRNAEKLNSLSNESKAIASTRKAVTGATSKPGQFKNWTQPIHGLALSVFQQPDSTDTFRVIVVAVRNTSTEPLKLMPAGPDLLVEVSDDRGKSINLETIKKLHTEVSDASGSIAAGATTYYSIAYAPIVLGSHQHLKIVLGHSNAADEPASVELATAKR